MSSPDVKMKWNENKSHGAINQSLTLWSVRSIPLYITLTTVHVMDLAYLTLFLFICLCIFRHQLSAHCIVPQRRHSFTIIFKKANQQQRKQRQPFILLDCGSLCGWEQLWVWDSSHNLLLESPFVCHLIERQTHTLPLSLCVFAFWAPCVEWATSCDWHCQIRPFKKKKTYVYCSMRVCVCVLHTIFRLWRILHYSC